MSLEVSLHKSPNTANVGYKMQLLGSSGGDGDRVNREGCSSVGGITDCSESSQGGFVSFLSLG